MSNVINKLTKQYLRSVNTPDYPKSEWIINPILPKCDKKFWIIEGDTVVEMTDVEKDAYTYDHESIVYLITEKKLLANVNGTSYETDTNVIINPVMPFCDINYTKVVDGIVVEMSQEEKKAIDLPDEISKNKQDIISEIRLIYTMEDEIDILVQLAFGSLETSDQEAVDYVNVVQAAKDKYPKKI